MFTLATDQAGHPVVIAGCRFSRSEAQVWEHWQRTRAGTPLGEETFAILDMLERIHAIRGPEPMPVEAPLRPSKRPDAMIVWAIADRVLPFVGLCVLLIGFEPRDVADRPLALPSQQLAP